MTARQYARRYVSCGGFNRRRARAVYFMLVSRQWQHNSSTTRCVRKRLSCLGGGGGLAAERSRPAAKQAKTVAARRGALRVMPSKLNAAAVRRPVA